MCEKRQSGYIACNCTTDITCNEIAAWNKRWKNRYEVFMTFIVYVDDFDENNDLKQA